LILELCACLLKPTESPKVIKSIDTCQKRGEYWIKMKIEALSLWKNNLEFPSRDLKICLIFEFQIDRIKPASKKKQPPMRVNLHVVKKTWEKGCESVMCKQQATSGFKF
jgi:hypothetical protein